MKHRSIRSQLGAVFLGFLMLVVSSVAVTFWLIQSQQADATIINLAGRQRMLTQQMVRLALTQPDSIELKQTLDRFTQTLTALSNGGEVLNASNRRIVLPPTTDPTIRAQLDEVATIWPAFQSRLYPPVDHAALEADAALLLTQLDGVVTAYEAQARTKVTRLHQVQLFFLLTAFLLLAWGYAIIQRHIIRPLVMLSKVAEAIGAGHLSQPTPVLPDNELGQLAHTMGRMRTEIAAHRHALEQQVAQRTKELTVAFEFSQEIVRHFEPAELLQSVAHRARELMHGQAASVCVLVDNGRTLELTASSGTAVGYNGLRQSSQHGLALPVIQQHKTVMADSYCSDCGFLHQFSDVPCIAAPLQVGGRSLGALCVVHPQCTFDMDESQALTLLANAAAIALENARLIATGKQQAEENASLAERQRLSAELHDNLAQTLGAINLSAGMIARDIAADRQEAVLNRLEGMQANLKSAYAQLRMALTGLQEPPPNDGEFVQNLQTCLNDFREQTGLLIELSMCHSAFINLPPVTQKQALHILHESLVNIQRHAQASCVHISVTNENGVVQFVVADDGIGFVPAQVNGQNHLGLSIMQTRAERSGGRFSVHSSPGEGTRITATFPVRGAREASL